MKSGSFLKHLILINAHKTGLFELGRIVRKDRISILCYHRFTDSPGNGTALSAGVFDAQLRYLKKRFTFISFRDALDLIGGRLQVENPLILSVDDGYRDFVDVALPLLLRHGVPATLFVVPRFVDGEIWLWPDIVNYAIAETKLKKLEIPLCTTEFQLETTDHERATCAKLHRICKEMNEDKKNGFLAELVERLNVKIPPSPTEGFSSVTWDDLKRIRTESLEIGSHTLTHPILSKTREEQAEFEIRESKRQIEQELGTEVVAFAYPNGMPGDYTAHDKEVLKKSGYVFGVTCNFGVNALDSDPLEFSRIVAQHNLARFAKEVSGFEILIRGNSEIVPLVQSSSKEIPMQAPTTNGAAEVRVTLCSETEKAKWDAFVDRSKDGSIFHRYGWKNVFEQVYGNECLYLRAEENGSTVGILPLVFKKSLLFGKFLVSLPYFDYAGICSEREDVRRLLFEHAREFAGRRNAEYIEFRHERELDIGLSTKQSKVTMVLELAHDPEMLWTDLKAKVRNQVRKAQREELSIKSGGPELVDDFFGIYATNMRDLSSPSHCREFFRCIFDIFPESVRIFCVEKGGETLASGYTIMSKDTLTIPWASSLRKHNAKCPNMLLYWGILEYACKSGFSRFGFGRSTLGDGTYQFKRQWGARPKQLYWQYWLAKDREMPDLNTKNSKYKLPVKVWKTLPVALTRRLGPRLIRSLP